MLGTLHIFDAILHPLIDWVLALSTLSWEVREPLLEGQTEDFDIDVVSELLANDEEEVAEDESSEQVDNVGSTGRECHRCLVKEDEEGRKR